MSAGVATMAPGPSGKEPEADRMQVDAEPHAEAHGEADLYTRLKTLQRQLEFLDIRVSAPRRPRARRPADRARRAAVITSRSPALPLPRAPSQEEYIKEEQKNLKHELLRAQEEVKRIQVRALSAAAVPLRRRRRRRASQPPAPSTRLAFKTRAARAGAAPPINLRKLNQTTHTPTKHPPNTHHRRSRS